MLSSPSCAISPGHNTAGNHRFHTATPPPTYLKVLRLSNLTRSMRSSVCWNCSSVSPGKPTMTSPVMAASGANWKSAGGEGGRDKQMYGGNATQVHQQTSAKSKQSKQNGAETRTTPLSVKQQSLRHHTTTTTPKHTRTRHNTPSTHKQNKTHTSLILSMINM